MTFLFAGHGMHFILFFQLKMFILLDTTTNLLTWAFYFVSIHPEVEANIQRELDTTLSGKSPSFDELDKLEYLSKVVKETLRMRPSAPGLSRIATRDTTLTDYSIPNKVRSVEVYCGINNCKDGSDLLYICSTS